MQLAESIYRIFMRLSDFFVYVKLFLLLWQQVEATTSVASLPNRLESKEVRPATLDESDRLNERELEHLRKIIQNYKLKQQTDDANALNLLGAELRKAEAVGGVKTDAYEGQDDLLKLQEEVSRTEFEEGLRVKRGWRERIRARMDSIYPQLKKLAGLPELVPALLPSMVLTAATHPRLFAAAIAAGLPNVFGNKSVEKQSEKEKSSISRLFSFNSGTAKKDANTAKKSSGFLGMFQRREKNQQM